MTKSQRRSQRTQEKIALSRSVLPDGALVRTYMFGEEVVKPHPKGWLVEWQPAVETRGWAKFFRNLADAKAELAKIAEERRKDDPCRAFTMSGDGSYLDASVPGCYASRYFISKTTGVSKPRRCRLDAKEILAPQHA